MAEQLKIIIDADVVKAIGGLDKLEQHFKTTENSAKKFGTTIQKSTQVATPALNTFAKSSNTATQSMINLGRVVQDAPFGFLGIANNLNPLLESFQRLKAESGSTKTALKALGSSFLGAGGLGFALSVVSSLLIVFGNRIFGIKKSTDDAKEAIPPFITVIDRMNKRVSEAVETIAKDAAKISILSSAINSGSLSLNDRKKAIEEVLRLYPEYLNSLEKEKSGYEKITIAITDSFVQLAKAAEVKALLPDFEDIISKGINAQVRLNRLLRETVIKPGEEGGGVIFFGVDEADFLKEKKQLEDIIRLTKREIETAKQSLAVLAGGEFNLIKILFGDSLKTAPKDLKDVGDAILSRARQFVKEFGDTFVVPDLEESFFRGKKELLPLAQKLLEDVAKGNLKIKIPVAIEFVPLAESFELTQSQIENFFSEGRKNLEMPIGFKLDPSLFKESIKGIDEMIAAFAKFGDAGLEAYAKISVGNRDFIKGLEELNSNLQVEKFIATELQGVFETMFSSISEGVNSAKALFDSLKQVITKLIVKLAAAAVAAALLNALSGGSFAGAKGFGGIFKSLLGFGSSSGGGFGLGNQIGSRAFNNVLTVNVVGNISGQNILLAGQRAAGSNKRTG